MCAEEDDGNAAFRYCARQFKDKLPVQFDVQQRCVNATEAAKAESLADTLKGTDHATARHADDGGYIDCRDTLSFRNKDEAIGEIVCIDRHLGARVDSSSGHRNTAEAYLFLDLLWIMSFVESAASLGIRQRVVRGQCGRPTVARPKLLWRHSRSEAEQGQLSNKPMRHRLLP
jgi:hypothetical protein